MAYTKIKPIRVTLQKCIQYTLNPEKTQAASPVQTVLQYTQNEAKTAQRTYVTGFHCTPETAYQTMEQTRSFWGKGGKGHVQGYHVIQSFAPGEVTPEQAHEIGCEFVRRVLPQYEATVSTHLDRGHLHNHIVFNSVACEDGKMFRDDFKGYYEGIRAQSDALCREYGLSIIQPKGKGKAYNERQAEKEGKPTIRSQVREDVDRALEKAVSWQTFVLGLQRMGYTVRYGPNIKYATVQHCTGKRAIRLKSLGEGYSEQELRARIKEKKTQPPMQKTVAVPQSYHHRWGRYRGGFPLRPRRKYTGFLALYYHYVYLFGKAGRSGHSAKRTQYLLRDDLAKFDRYVAQAEYLWANHIETNAQLAQTREWTESLLDTLCEERKMLYAKRRCKNVDQEKLQAERQELTQAIRTCRKEIRLCDAIAADAEHLRQQLEEARRQELEAQQRENKKRPAQIKRKALR